MQCRLSLEEAEAGVQLLVLAPLPPPVEGRWLVGGGSYVLRHFPRALL